MPSSLELKPQKPSIWKSQLRTKRPSSLEDVDFSGKVAIITGSNVGLGLEAARQMLDAKLLKLILAVRSIKKGERAASQLRSFHPNADIEVWPLDMSSYSSIQAFVQRCDALPILHIAILNAGVAKFTFETNSATGHEEAFQVNYLSTVLLAILLLPVLKDKSHDSSAGRLTIVSSATALTANIRAATSVPIFPAMDDNKVETYNSQARYSVTKLLGHLWMTKLVEYVEADDVIVNLVEPGFVKGTALFREAGGIYGFVLGFVSRLIGHTLSRGASTYVDAVANHGQDAHGSFLLDWKIYPFAPMVYTTAGKEAAQRLWEETLEELKFAEVHKILQGMKGQSFSANKSQ